MSHYVDLQFEIRKEALDRANDVIRETLKATRAFEGNLSATVLRSTEDNKVVNILTVWEQASDHAAYLDFRSSKEGTPVELFALFAEDPISRHWDVQTGV
ncbi:antibiotic biosynthesis monooxygenase family protein [Paenibacillus camerounensis]|uniref:antibiotic biosynthesis monooxygenase family protein n=1 Tax=Paenibacillus camerounensis TaxID=1243663 RepID=UPI0005AAA5B0|nr:antibiotic biosynthesis monooxygenase family protein [Paenibacillus camerounensis]